MNTSEHHIEEYQLISYLSGQADEALVMKIEKWRKQSEDNDQHYQQVKKLWEEAEGVINFDKIDVDGHWRSVKEIVGISEEKKSAKVFRLGQMWKVAAAILLLLTFSVVIYQVVFQQKNDLIIITAETGATNQYTLPDGSLVWLNENSELSYPPGFTGTEREVALKGEGFFEVVPQTDKPFIVTVNGSETKVLGTSFNLKGEADTKAVELVLVEGKVQFSTKDQSEVLSPGEKVSIDSQGKFLKERNTNINFLAWKTDTLTFVKTPLADAIKEINKLYKVEIILQSEALKKCSLTANFENDPLENVIETLTLLFNLDVMQKSNIQYIFSGKGC